jgi:DNA recombination protein RmuC
MQLLPLLIGAVVGVTLAGLFFMSRLRRVEDLSRSDLELERATSRERLEAREQQLRELKSSHERGSLELERQREELRSESERRSAAEEKNARIPELENDLRGREEHAQRLQKEITWLRAKLSEVETRLLEERKASGEKLALLEEARARLSDAFSALSSEALRSNNQSFLELAGTVLEKFHASARGDLEMRQQAIGELVKPLKDSLEKVDSRLSEIEHARTSAYAGITEQMKALAHAQNHLQRETSNLVNALRAPNVRGRWGEIQLKRVVELAGMVEYCDFVQQESGPGTERRLRPDMIIRLPNGKNVVVDSKTPLQAYLDALEARDDSARLEKLKDHARQVRSHLSQLSSKAYWDQFRPAPEFAVLFLPGETFFSAALEQDPGLIEFGVERSVILATPTTLIALLRSVAYGWRQERIAENALAISDLGRKLYERLRGFVVHFGEIRKGLDRAVDAYNRSVGSMEGRVLVSARKFKDLGASVGDDIETIEVIDRAPRDMRGSDGSGSGGETEAMNENFPENFTKPLSDA